MKPLGLGLVILLSASVLNAKEESSKSSSATHIESQQGEEDKELVNAFKIALQSLGIDSETEEIKALIYKHMGMEKLDLLKLVVKSAKGVEQFHIKYGRDPEDSDIESAYKLLEDTYAALSNKGAKSKAANTSSSKAAEESPVVQKQKSVSDIFVGGVSSLIMHTAHSREKHHEKHHHERSKVAADTTTEHATSELCSACGHHHHHGNHDHNSHHHGHDHGHHSHSTLAHACGSGCSH
jgi:hypothetical protein